MCPPKALEGLSRNTSPRDAAPMKTEGPTRQTLSYHRIVDLTQPTHESSPLYPGTRPFERKVTATHEDDTYYSAEIYLNEHTGTHMDAPAHFGAGQATIDQVPAQDLLLPLAIIDITTSTAKEHASLLSIDDLSAWEKAHGLIPERALVCMHSGWGTRYTDTQAFLNADSSGVCHFPGFHPDAAAWLHEERAAVGIGVDTLSLDHGPSQDFLTHRQWCGSGKWGIENLTNLDQLPPSGAWAFIGIPKLVDGSGAPCRVLALT